MLNDKDTKSLLNFYMKTPLKELTEVHNDMIYIGKLKVVPSDNSFSFNKKRALKALIKEAKKYGARFVFIKGINTTSSDYVFIPWDWTWGDGVTIEAELYY